MDGGACSTVHIALRTCRAGYVNEVTACNDVYFMKTIWKMLI